MNLDDLWRLRLRREASKPTTPSSAPGGSPAFVGQNISVSPEVGKFILVRPMDVIGDEAAGASATISVASPASIPVYLLGPGVPQVGDNLVVRHVPYRWVAELSGVTRGYSDFGTIPNCSCTTIPATLTMTSFDEACNYRMFQSCTIQYGPTPAGYAALNLGTNSFLSVESFPDPVSGGAMFRYFLTCQYNQISITRVYETSPFGSPYRDGVLYTWIMGLPGNTCSPFEITNGQPFPGSDLSCNVDITS
ncbi:hypothetical protein P12x_003045 [Tundrisphaera lichenicola]|uniref:hypothetical protein n=1 Tax=Tundrisphaera lichenicola TaxID=2029860 RepID=UPI003EB7CFE5